MLVSQVALLLLSCAVLAVVLWPLCASYSRVTSQSEPSDGEELDADPEKYFLYFGFGSNLDKERLQLTNPSAKYVTNAKIDGYELGFTGIAKGWHGAVGTIFEKPGSVVYGAVYRLENIHSETLDRQEGKKYRRISINVTTIDKDGKPGDVLTLRTYQAKKLPTPEDLPSPHYKTVIFKGAESLGFPQSYVDWIKGLPDNGYAGKVKYDLKSIKHLNYPAA